MSASTPGSSSCFDQQKIVNLNVGGQRFSTSKQTLTSVPDTFFTSLLSGRIPLVKDETGAIFVDRDPLLFRLILNYLRTKQVDVSGVSIKALTHEAQFYGITPLVKSLTLCEELDQCACGDVLFHGYLPPPSTPLVDDSSAARKPTSSSMGAEISSTFEPSTSKASGNPNKKKYKGGKKSCNESDDSSTSRGAVSGNSQRREQIHKHIKKGSHDFSKFIKADLLKETSRLHEKTADPLRVRVIRAHHNSIAVGYQNFVCCYRMKDSVGWQLMYTSPRMNAPISHIALNTKFGAQNSEKMLAVALANHEIHLWSMIDQPPIPQPGVIPLVGAPPLLDSSSSGRTVGTKMGTFSMSVPIDKLFFIGTQLVALSKTGKVGVWHSMTHNWQVQDVVSISCYDTAGSVLLLGCTNGSIYYIDMQKFPLRMKDNDLLITELYSDPNNDVITAISVYLTPKTNLCGNWIEIAYGTSSGCVRVIVQHPETVGHGPQLFQTYTVHTSPITRVALTTNHLISVCSEYNHVRSWGVTRFRGMISTQPGSTSLASYKVLTLDSTDESSSDESTDYGPFGDQDGEQLFVQRIVPDTNILFVRLASNGDRLATINSIDNSPITAFLIHECEGSNRMGSRPRRFLFTGSTNGGIQMWDLTTAIDQYNSRVSFSQSILSAAIGQTNAADKAPSAAASAPPATSLVNSNSISTMLAQRSLASVLQGPTPEELLQLIDECEICCNSTGPSPSSSTAHLPGLDHYLHHRTY
ncbi:hypothetical protein QR680_004727 [Steinernema hermaphroditum]|uniref:BTB domain-containing protein n=1 Tax=Steinernema hermaphroditum TaxID=289476 RepID=A0AA39LTN6_9BILA|nr:hypothetical protein QR680_004727 [Steinernema hermaphroditum]